MKPPLNTCTECNEENVKIHRNYKNRRFCGKCYFKYFKLDECPKCHQIARLPTFNLNPVCIVSRQHYVDHLAQITKR